MRAVMARVHPKCKRTPYCTVFLVKTLSGTVFLTYKQSIQVIWQSLTRAQPLEFTVHLQRPIGIHALQELA